MAKIDSEDTTPAILKPIQTLAGLATTTAGTVTNMLNGWLTAARHFTSAGVQVSLGLLTVIPRELPEDSKDHFRQAREELTLAMQAAIGRKEAEDEPEPEPAKKKSRSRKKATPVKVDFEDDAVDLPDPDDEDDSSDDED